MWSPSIKPWRSKCPAAMVVDPLVGNPLLSFSRSISTRQCQCHCQCQATNMLSGITAQVHGLTPYKATSNIKKLIIILTHNLQMCVWDEITKQKIFLILFYVLYLFNPPLWKSTIPTSSSNRHYPNRKSDIAPSFHFLEGIFIHNQKGVREWDWVQRWRRSCLREKSISGQFSIFDGLSYETAEIHELTAVRFDQDLIWFSIYFGPTKHRNQGQAFRLTFLAVLCLEWYRENMWSKLDGIRA